MKPTFINTRFCAVALLGAGFFIGRCLCANSFPPFAVIPNEGQFDSDTLFVARAGNQRILFKQGQIVFRENRAPAISLRFLGANSNAEIQGLDLQRGHSNYLVGRQASQWHTQVPHFSRVIYRDLYPGIDLIFYAKSGQLEYDLVVSAGVNPNQIEMELKGGSHVRLSQPGDAEVATAGGQFRLLKPRVYQQDGDERKEISGRYILTAPNRLAIKVSHYNRNQKLVIDPAISYSSFLGGSSEEVAYGIAVDRDGNSYITGFTESIDFPASTKNAMPAGVRHAFVAKLDPTGSTLLYATYLDGSGMDIAYAVAVDSSNNAYITGSTTSGDFPTTSGAFRTASKGGLSDAFVAKLNASGDGLVYSTYLGGTLEDSGYGVALDSSNEAIIAGFTSSTDFPTAAAYRTKNGGGLSDAFVTKLNASGTALIYSTYLGGAGEDVAYGVAVDALGNAYVAGYEASTDFPVTPGAVQSKNAGGYDAFVTALNTSGAALYSTLLGGDKEDYAMSIAVDRDGSAYVTGYTASSGYPATSGAFQHTKANGYDAFLTKLTSTGSLAYSTFLGASDDDFGLAIAVDSDAKAYVTGTTASTDFATTADAISAPAMGMFNVFVTRLSPDGSALDYSTYVGASGFAIGYALAIDTAGSAYVAGYTMSSDFPISTAAAQASFAGASDAFVMKIAPGQPGPPLTTPTISVSPASLDFGPVSINQNKDLTLNVLNTGPVALNVTSVSTSSAVFSWISPAAPFTVAPGAKRTATVRFTPADPAAQSGTITISSDDPNHPSTSVKVSGTGVAPGSAKIDITPSKLDFGQVTVNQSKDMTLTVGANSGTDVLAITSILSDNPKFTVVSPTPPFSITPNPLGGLVSVVVRFSPSAAGAQSGNLTIASNASNQPSLTVPVTGAGVTAPSGDVLLKLDGGTFESAIGIPDGAPVIVFVNRLTPPSYPATLKNVQIYFANRSSGLPIGSAITIIAATNPSGSAVISAATAGTINVANATVSSRGVFTTYPMPPLTITSGDFVVGFITENPVGIYPADLDDITLSQRRSYVSLDGVSFDLIDDLQMEGNFGIRATVTLGTSGASGEVSTLRSSEK